MDVVGVMATYAAYQYGKKKKYMSGHPQKQDR